VQSLGRFDLDRIAAQVPKCPRSAWAEREVQKAAVARSGIV
jgi:hypothetical protein